jgi:hypothetical protein
MTKQTPRTRRKLVMERFPLTRELDRTRVRGQARLPPHRRGVPTSMRSWPKRASSRPNSRRSTALCDYFVPPSPGKPPRGERARELGKQARVRINVDNPSTPPPPRERVRSSLLPRHCSEPCPLPQRPRHETCTAMRRRSSSKRPCSRLRARCHASASRGARETTGARKALRRQFTRVARRGSPPTKAGRRSGSGSLTRVGRPKTATLATSSTPGGRAKRKRGRRQATTHGEVGAMTAESTAR